MGYDRTIALFSPDGRLLQVEYAKEPVLKGSPVLAMKGKGGYVMISYRPIDLKKTYGSFLILESVKKILKVDDKTYVGITGILSDGRVLAEKAGNIAISYRYTYGKEIPIDLLTKYLGNYIQLFTQWGGARPFGASIIMCGFKKKEPKIFMVEPSGIYFEYKVTAIGKNSDKILEYIQKNNYREDSDLESLVLMGVQAIKENIEELKERELEEEELEIVIVNEEGGKELSKEEIKEIIEKCQKKS